MTAEPQHLTFYFDPLCPFAWRASLWMREVRAQRPLQVHWKFFSLNEAHRDPDLSDEEEVEADDALRVLALARRDGGDDAVDRLYLALGKARHERKQDLGDHAVIAAALEESELPASLLGQALDDPSTSDEVLAEHRAAVEQHGAYGVPWLVPAGQEFGFNGPVMTEAPRGETALGLWEHVSWLLQQPYFYEFKRERA